MIRLPGGCLVLSRARSRRWRGGRIFGFMGFLGVWWRGLWGMLLSLILREFSCSFVLFCWVRCVFGVGGIVGVEVEWDLRCREVWGAGKGRWRCKWRGKKDL